MDQQKLTALLRQNPELPERTTFCPENRLIAQYSDATLSVHEHKRVQKHVSECVYCQSQLGAIARAFQEDSCVLVDEDLLASDKQLAHKNPARWQKMAPRWAAAAVLVMALLMTVDKNQRLVEPWVQAPTASLSDDNSRQLRGVQRNATNLEVLNPTQGADIKPGSLLQWADIPGALHYDIFVLSNTGDVLWTQRLVGNDWVLDGTLQLTSGNQYFFRVEALLPDGRSVSSRHVVFKVSG